MLLFRNQNQFPSSFAPLGDLLNALMFLSNLNGFNYSPSPPDQRFAQMNGSSKVWKEKCLKWFSHTHTHSLSLSLLMVMHYLFVMLSYFWASLVLCFAWFNMFLFVFFFSVVYFCFWYKNNNTKTVCVLWTLVLVYRRWPLKQSFLNFVSFVT